MSSYAANVARWNAIPMARESPSSTTGTKRSRSRSRSASPVLKLQGEYDSSDEDKVSLVSRSPSPSADKMDITAYDEYHPAAERDVITIETKIKSTNKGYSMLAKLGWTAGQPLGLSGDGLIDPIPFSIKNDVTGLGKRSQDERMIETTVSQRRGLDSERQIRETVEQRQTREQKVAEQEVLKNQIASTLKAFYCALCDKQYQTVAQYDEHTNSYAHHHKQRFKDMQTNAKGLGGGKQDKEARLAKERKREAKELKRMAKAQGMKVSGIGGVVSANTSTPVPPPPSAEDSKGFKKSGWATVSTPAQPPMTADESKRNPETSGLMAIPGGTPSSSTNSAALRRENPGFRTAGFETLETTSSPTEKSGGWSTVSNADSTGPEPPRSAWVKLPTPFAPPSSIAPGPPPPPSIPPPPPPPFSESLAPPPPNFPQHPLSPPRYARPPSPRRGLPDPKAPYPNPNDKPRFNRPPSPPRRDDYNPRDWRDRTRYHTYRGDYRG